ncbi:MAG: LTA synthase family protein [Gammaproteobacteria bacterium]|nr:LTA synthase family protein [Gammaproteobacteria bacterium]
MSIAVYLLTLMPCLLMDRFARPDHSITDRKTLAISLNILTYTIAFLLFFLVTRRPFFTAAAVLLGHGVLIVVSNAKFKALREPLVISDLVLFTQALRHPRLYLPFLGAGQIIAFLLVGGLVTYGCLALEPAAFTYGSSSPVALLSLGLLTTGLVVTSVVVSKKLTPTLAPSEDIKHFGLAASLVIYLVMAIRTPATVLSSSFSVPKEGSKPSISPQPGRLHRPNIIVIQSESFFDARKLHPSIRTDILKHFDCCIAEAQNSGRLEVPAWGAYTMRSEFSFLTGIPNSGLGIRRFDPYQSFSGRHIPSIASHLKSQGYRCLCIHPNQAGFFGRDRLFSLMGFDEFLDISVFEKSQRFGPYISDLAVAEKILETLDESNEPLFVFAITMENHGPLHLEAINPEDRKRVYQVDPPNEFHDLSVYLRHLENADRMIGRITSELKDRTPDSVLCFYGDHVPSMPAVYDTLDFNDGKTDYFIWHPGGSRPKHEDIPVDALAARILENLQVR